jgi:hypothetical protein
MDLMNLAPPAIKVIYYGGSKPEAVRAAMIIAFLSASAILAADRFQEFENPNPT